MSIGQPLTPEQYARMTQLQQEYNRIREELHRVQERMMYARITIPRWAFDRTDPLWVEEGL